MTSQRELNLGSRINKMRLQMPPDERNMVHYVVKQAIESHLADEFSETLIARGLSDLVRALIKASPIGRLPAAQIGLWSPTQAALVEQIGRESLYVPSRGAFVDLTPDNFTADMMDEAGDYLHNEANATMRRADLVKALAQLMHESEAAHASA